MDRLIERAASGSGPRYAANEREAMWKESERRHREKVRRENRAAWYAYHLDQAERLRRTMTALVEAHEAKAAALLEPGVLTDEPDLYHLRPPRPGRDRPPARRRRQPH